MNQRYEQVLQTYNEDGIIDTYTYGVQRISSTGQNNETYLYDGRGSVTGSVNVNNEFISYSYTAYGELMPDSPTPKVYSYNAEATDYTTGLQYLRARYYDTGISRFVQEDDYRGSFTIPISMNRYAYVYNNPLMGVDSSGYKSISYYDNMISSLEKQVNSWEISRDINKQYALKYLSLRNEWANLFRYRKYNKLYKEYNKRYLGANSEIGRIKIKIRQANLAREAEIQRIAWEARKQSRIEEIQRQEEERQLEIEVQKVAAREKNAASILGIEAPRQNNNKPTAVNPQDETYGDNECNIEVNLNPLKYPDDYPPKFVKWMETRNELQAEANDLQIDIKGLNEELKNIALDIAVLKRQKKENKVDINWDKVPNVAWDGLLVTKDTILLWSTYGSIYGDLPDNSAALVMDFGEMLDNKKETDLRDLINGLEFRKLQIEKNILPYKESRLSDITTFDPSNIFAPSISSIDRKLKRNYFDLLNQYYKENY